MSTTAVLSAQYSKLQPSLARRFVAPYAVCVPAGVTAFTTITRNNCCVCTVHSLQKNTSVFITNASAVGFRCGGAFRLVFRRFADFYPRFASFYQRFLSSYPRFMGFYQRFLSSYTRYDFPLFPLH